MKVKLSEKYEIETAHPASHYGAGVMLETATGRAFGPADFMPGVGVSVYGLAHIKILVGDAVASCVRGRGFWTKRFSREEVEQVRAFLSQDPAGRFTLPPFEQLEKEWADAEGREDEENRQ